MSPIETGSRSDAQPALTVVPVHTTEKTRKRLTLSLGGNKVAEWARNGLVAAGLLTAETGCPEMMINTDTLITSGGSSVPTEGHNTTGQQTSSSMGTLDGTASETMNGTESGTQTTGITDGTTIDTDTDPTTGEIPCPENACIPENTEDCKMSGELMPICTCKEGYTGDCSVCAKGYEKNVLDECEIDKTPPTIRIDTNKGFSPYFIPTASFKFEGDCMDTPCPEQNAVEVYYRKNGLPVDGELDPNFKAGSIKWSREYFGLIKDEVNTYSVKMKDGNGNFSEWKDFVVVRSF